MDPTQRTIAKLVLIALFVPLAWWLLASLNADVKPSPRIYEEVEQATTSNERIIRSATPPIGERAIESILAQQGSYECTEDSTGDDRSRTILYISDGKLHTQLNNTRTVYDGRFIYRWKMGAISGKKSPVTSLDQFPSELPQELLSGHIQGETYKISGWSCVSWATRSSMFAPPPDIKFTF